MSEITIIMYAVTISWIFLAYSVKPKLFKEILYWFVFANIVLMSYSIYGLGKSVSVEPQVAENYLVIQTLMFTAYIMIYFITWILQMLKRRKVDKQTVFEDGS